MQNVVIDAVTASLRPGYALTGFMRPSKSGCTLYLHTVIDTTALPYKEYDTWEEGQEDLQKIAGTDCAQL